MRQLNPNNPVAFTTRYNGRSNVLSNDVGITPAFDPQANPRPRVSTFFKAVWDTGATASVITEAVVAQCGLIQTGVIEVFTAQGSYLTETYLVNIFLPNRVGVHGVAVSKGTLPHGSDVLIGMDIIGVGDFAVTNKDGITVFTFRMPSVELLDFTANPVPGVTTPVGQARQSPVAAPVSRNSKCACGSGKKYKRCHGKDA